MEWQGCGGAADCGAEDQQQAGSGKGGCWIWPQEMPAISKEGVGAITCLRCSQAFWWCGREGTTYEENFGCETA